MTEVIVNGEKPKANPKLLREAIEQLRDGDYKTYAEYQRDWMESAIKRWAWYLGEGEYDGKKLTPIPTRLWPMMAVLFENQMAVSPRRRGRSYEDALFEATTRGDVAWPARISLPIVRDVFPLLFMNRISGLQPMPPQSGGTMKIFYWSIYREDVSPSTNVTTPDSDYAVSSEGAVPKRLKSTLTEDSVTAVKKMLAATWTQDVEEDIAGVHGIDLPRELMDACAQEILREIEEDVLNRIYAGATAGTATWSWTKPESYAGVSHTEYYQTLYHAILDANKLIRDERHREIQYMVCGTNVVTYLQKSNYFRTSPDNSSEGPIQSGVLSEGKLGKWDVYSTTYLDEDAAFVSYYPVGMLHAGHIWCPYIPLTPMQRVYAAMNAYDDDENQPGGLVNNDSWTQNVRTRNGDKLVQGKMFAKVNIQEAAVE